jgi:predicted DsbA family dithiol-disulfide isomerase
MHTRCASAPDPTVGEVIRLHRGHAPAPTLAPATSTIEVYADIACPFAHVGLRSLTAERDARAPEVALRVRSWPLEWVNNGAHDPDHASFVVDALRASVAPDLFAGFDPATYPCSTISALGLVSVAYLEGDDVGGKMSLALRDAVFEQGRALDDPNELRAIAHEFGLEVPAPALAVAVVRTDWERGRSRHVQGSPHFFLGERSWFCPSLRIGRGANGFDITVDRAGLEDFLTAALG